MVSERGRMPWRSALIFRGVEIVRDVQDEIGEVEGGAEWGWRPCIED